MCEVDTIEKVIAAVKQQMEEHKDIVAAMTEEEREAYVEELLYQEFLRMVKH